MLGAVRGELTGEQLGNYRLESVLGRGGMGIVYLAEQVSLGRAVAVKVIAPELSQDALSRDRFKQEARLAASLDHPHVLPVYEAEEADGLLYIAMRYVRGADLRQEIASRGRLDLDEAASIVMQVGGALDAAHARGLVHRDVKPANVLLAEGDSGRIAYLTDFGLTKHVAAVAGPTRTGVFVGTPDYAAPEQIEGGPVSAATDVYALGCVLYQAVTGAVPFPRDSDLAKMWAHIQDPPPRPSAAAGGIDPALDEVISRALSKEPAGRYLSAGDLGRAAIAAAAHRGVTDTERSVAVGEAALSAAAVRTVNLSERPTELVAEESPPAATADAEGNNDNSTVDRIVAQADRDLAAMRVKLKVEKQRLAHELLRCVRLGVATAEQETDLEELAKEGVLTAAQRAQAAELGVFLPEL
jgi:serine/threonine protein kinase